MDVYKRKIKMQDGKIRESDNKFNPVVISIILHSMF